jgi:hypothetical protein
VIPRSHYKQYHYYYYYHHHHHHRRRRRHHHRRQNHHRRHHHHHHHFHYNRNKFPFTICHNFVMFHADSADCANAGELKEFFFHYLMQCA